MTTTKLMTVEELEALPEGDKRYELLDGVLTEMSPVGWPHDQIRTTIAYELQHFVKGRDLGRVWTGDTGIILRRNPDRVRAPDVSFVSQARLPRRPAFSEVVPDLVVEIISPGDRASEVEQKTAEWLAAGARLVWNVYPVTKHVVAFHGTGEIRIYRDDDLLDAEPVLPGFSVPVRSLFE